MAWPTRTSPPETPITSTTPYPPSYIPESGGEELDVTCQHPAAQRRQTLFDTSASERSCEDLPLEKGWRNFSRTLAKNRM
ncbi:hypothetical protein CEXT_748991 [Caerostris extrusa]|uniref:Uncharacterized protein n=1 Tax=Caerostris extrusa TaxID=172846 RepID=A0AAV4Y5Y2_CAEEX|nr:hypothetical protein CEXT_748991 [Caerostris extrusa]